MKRKIEFKKKYVKIPNSPFSEEKEIIIIDGKEHDANYYCSHCGDMLEGILERSHLFPNFMTKRYLCQGCFFIWLDTDEMKLYGELMRDAKLEKEATKERCRHIEEMGQLIEEIRKRNRNGWDNLSK